ncbi:MAG: phage tail tape measure protein [Methanomicrobium sp.]|nr:phage tail tape measure protein [Methanomicrobium sp.]
MTAGMSFDSSMSQVAATMGTTVDEITNLRDFAQEMGSRTAFSATEAADALNYMALAGYSAEQSMEMLPNVLNLASAGGFELARASDMVTVAQSALGLSGEVTTAMVDQMARASSKSNTSVEQLGDAILTIGATARGVKGGTVELSTVLGALADNGIKGAEGGTHLRNMLLSLQTPTKDGTEALAKLGMTYDDMYDSAGNMRAIPEIMMQMQSKMEGMTQASKDAIISGIFNKTDLAAANALLGTSKDRFDELTEAITDSTGAAQDMADTQLDNLQGDITLFKSALEGAKIAISDGLTPSLRGFVSFGTEALSTLTDAFKEGGLSGAMDALGDLLSDGITMIIEKLPTFIEAGTQLLIALITGLIENAPLLIDATIQMVQVLIKTLVANFPRIVEAGRNALQSLTGGMDAGQIAQKALELIARLLATIASNLPKILQKGIELVGQLAVGLIRGIPKAVASIPKIISKIRETFSQFDWASIGINIITGIGRGIANAASQIGEALLGAVKGAWNTVTGWLGIKSPSKKAEQEIGKNWALGIAQGFEKYMPSLEMVGAVSSTFNDMQGVVHGEGIAGNLTGGVYAFEIPVVVDGREIARATATYNQDELNRVYRNNNRKLGIIT